MKIVLDCILEPKFLDKNYKEHLIEILKKKYTYVSVKQGYIVSVNKILDIIYNEIDTNYNLKIKTLCDTNIIKLDKGIILRDCKITMIHNNGIFVNKYTIKILIPNNDNLFEYENNSCRYKDKVLKCGDSIEVKIQDIRFEKNEYTCIGIFKD